MTLNKRQEEPILKYIMFLLLLAIIAWWQVSFLQFSLKWDMIDTYLPWHRFSSEAIQNQIFPLWNPYQQLGYPIHADMRNIFSPELWIVSLFGLYSNLTLHLLVILYLFIAGSGMYLLSRFFKMSSGIAFICGASYMLSGYFIGHGQEMYSIIGGAFLPWILQSFLKLSSAPNLKKSLVFTIFLFLQLSGGYQAISIILFYFLLILFVYFIFQYIRAKKYLLLKQYLLFCSLSVVLIIILGGALIITYFQVADYGSRMEGLSFELAMQFPFSPQCLLSMILPFAIVKEIGFFNTDLSMSNAYCGLILFLFFIASLFSRKSSLLWIFLIFGCFSLLASFGDYFVVRPFLYKYIPLMDLFRFPSYFRIFFILALILSAGIELQGHIKDNRLIISRKFLLALSLTSILIIGLIVYAYPNIYFRNMELLTLCKGFQSALQNSSIYEHIFIQGLIQLSILFLLLVSNYKKWLNLRFLTFIILLDLVLSVQLNMNYNGVSAKNPIEAYQYLSSLPKGYPFPELKAVGQNSDESLTHLPYWRNTNIYHKRISADGFNSFWLKNTLVFLDSFPQLSKQIISNPPLYFSSCLLPLSTMKDTKIPEATCLYMADTIIKTLQEKEISFDSIANFQITSFKPGLISITTKTNSGMFLTLLQNYYPGWKVFIDNEERPIYISNTIFMSTFVDTGKHQIRFIYENNLVRNAVYISLSLFFLILLSIGFLTILKK